MLNHSERVPICSPHSAPLASASDICKAEENQQRTLEADTSNASVNQSPQSKIFHVSSPDNQDIDREVPSPTTRSENEELPADNLTPASPEPFPSPTPRSENKELAVDNSGLAAASPENVTTTNSSGSDTHKMEKIVSEQNLPEAVELNSSDNNCQSKVSPASSPSNKDLECECPSSSPRYEDKIPSSAPRSENKGLVVDNSASPENVTATNSSGSDTRKMEKSQQNVPEAVASNSSDNNCPQSKVSPASSPTNKDLECECPSSSPRSERVPAADNSLLASAAPENLTAAPPPASSTCKIDFVDERKTLHEGASNAPPHQSPRSHLFSVSSDNQDIEHKCPSPTRKSDSKEPPLDNSVLTPTTPENPTAASVSASDKCKMEEFVNQQKTLETDATNDPRNHPASLNQPPHSHIFPVSSDNQDIECGSPCPTPIADSKDPLVNGPVLISAGPENLLTVSSTCKVEEILNKERTVDGDASNVSLNQSPHGSTSCPDNQDMECEYPGPTERSESEQPLMDNSGLTSIVPETSASASNMCKMEMTLIERRTLEANPSNGSVIQSSHSKVLLVSSPEREFPSTGARPEIEEPVDLSSVLTSEAPENLAKQHVDSPEAFVLSKASPPNGESDFKCEQIIQKELCCESESTVVTRGDMIIDPSCGAESIDVSDVLESLMEEQRSGTLYMQGTTDLGDFLTTSAEEPQCSSPIALSPWGEPSYYQGDAVDSALWGVQDDPINDMWSLLSPRPALQPPSGIETEGKGTYDISEVGLALGNNEIVQRGSVPGVDNVNQVNLVAPTDWVLPEQVLSIPNDMTISSVAESTGVVGWQPSANQSLNEGTRWSTSQNLNISSNEKADPSSKQTWEASRKQESTFSSVSSSGEAIGSIRKGLNPPSGSANRGSQRSHQNHGRYSQISESWLLSSNQSRSRSDRFGSSGSSRSTSKGQTRG
nr:unnamed protein product [Digitaria exilis]